MIASDRYEILTHTRLFAGHQVNPLSAVGYQLLNSGSRVPDSEFLSA
jgi:hypothetical protein